MLRDVLTSVEMAAPTPAPGVSRLPNFQGAGSG